MKQTPQLDRVESRMRPGQLTLKGFLGHDDRKLVDIIAADQDIVNANSIDVEKLCNKLEQIADKGADIMESEKIVEDTYKVKVRVDRGKIPSPWGDGLFRKGDVELIHIESGNRLKWNELTLSMIRKHGFFGGKGSEYRIDPVQAKEVLNL